MRPSRRTLGKEKPPLCPKQSLSYIVPMALGLGVVSVWYNSYKAVHSEFLLDRITPVLPDSAAATVGTKSLSFKDYVETAKKDLPKRMCSCCGWTSNTALFQPYNGGRPDALCPQCRALERHRTSCALLGAQPALLDINEEHDLKSAFDNEATGTLRMIYFGPHQGMARAIDESTYAIDQIWADFENELLYNGNRTTKTVHADVMNLQFPDNFAHGALILHVLEHIPDLPLTFKELKRVLKPYSWILLEVPIREEVATKDCRAANTDEERIQCAGQKDHVWSFDIGGVEKELAAANLDCKNVHPLLLELVGESVYNLFQLKTYKKPVPQYLCRTPAN